MKFHSRLTFVTACLVVSASCTHSLKTSENLDQKRSTAAAQEVGTYALTPEPERRLLNDSEFTVDVNVHSSTILGRTVPYWILRPKNVQGSVPVLYFLHGLGESHLWFQELGGVEAYRKYLSSSGKPFAIVGLLGREGHHNYYWVDEAGDGGQPWATMLMDELIPGLEKRHLVGGHTDFRAIAGVSMGSAGAFQLAFNFPKDPAQPRLFSCVAGHSLVIREAASAVQFFSRQFGDIEKYKEKDPIELARRFSERKIQPFKKVWIDIGGADQDVWIKQAEVFRDELLLMGYSEESLDVGRRNPLGGHNNKYWQRHLPEWLKWYGDCFSN